METLRSILTGAVSMASFLVALFFLRFWVRTRDRFFLIFAIAFGIYAISQLVLGLSNVLEFEPLYYLPRVLTFLLIVLAVVEKNRHGH
ncbi:MAG TPA: DUF5985 family protein [Rhizomicrobium sp.]|nr:DUF5985 family protein [Rhizomicrobium sp.]